MVREDKTLSIVIHYNSSSVFFLFSRSNSNKIGKRLLRMKFTTDACDEGLPLSYFDTLVSIQKKATTPPEKGYYQREGNIREGQRLL